MNEVYEFFIKKKKVSYTNSPFSKKALYKKQYIGPKICTLDS